MKSRFLLNFAAIVLFTGFIAGNSANESPVLDLGILSDPQTSKMIGQMFAAPIVDAIKETNEESPLLAIPFGDLIGAGLQWLGGLVPKKQAPSAAHTDTSVTRTDLQSQSNAYSGRNSQAVPGQPLYSNGYFDQYGIFRPYQPIYSGPYVENQQGVHQIPQQQPIAAGNQNGPKHNLPMSGYPVYGFYDENGVFRPYQPIYNSPYVNNQQNSKTADGENGLANREVIVQNRPVAQPIQPTANTNLVEQTTSENRKSDGLRYSQNFPSISNTILPDDHDFANPVDVDTTRPGVLSIVLPTPGNHNNRVQHSTVIDRESVGESVSQRLVKIAASKANGGPCLPDHFDFSQPADVDKVRCGRFRLNLATQT